LPEAKLHEQVNGEWSLVETQRHLLFAGDAWLGNAVLEEEAPYHPLGFPAGGMPPDATAKLGLTLEATPTLDEVLAPRLARMATMRRVIDGLTEAELDRVCGRKPADPYPDQEYVVRRCLKVVLKEEAEHHRYAVRDLARSRPVPEPDEGAPRLRRRARASPGRSRLAAPRGLVAVGGHTCPDRGLATRRLRVLDSSSRRTGDQDDARRKRIGL